MDGQAMVLPGHGRGRVIQAEGHFLARWRSLYLAVMDIHGTLAITELPGKSVRYARALLGAERAYLAAATGPGPELSLYECLPDGSVERYAGTVSGGVLGDIIRLNTPFWLNETPAFQVSDVNGFRVRNLCGIPLSFAGQNTGALVAVNKLGGKPFTRHDREFLDILGCQAATALGNAREAGLSNLKVQENLAELRKLNDALSAQHARLQKSMTIHNLLTSLVLEGQGLDAITGSLAEIIGSSVVVTDQFLSPLSVRSGPDAADPRQIWQRAVADPARKEEILSLFKGKGLIQLNEPEGSGVELTVLPVVAGQDRLGFVVTLQDPHKLNELDYIALEHGSTVVALDLLKQKAAFQTELRLRKNFLKELMEGTYEFEEGVVWKARQLGVDLGQVHRVVVLETKSPEARDATGLSCRNLLPMVDGMIKGAHLSALLAEYNNDVIMLIPDEGAPQDKANNQSVNVLHKLADQFSVHMGHHTWWLGIGTPCFKVTDFSRSYREARACLEIARSLGRRNCSFAYEQLGVFSLLDINRDAFKEFAGRVIGPLLAYEEKYGTRFLPTLDLYYKNNCNILKTARNGFLSPSTLRYRLKRIGEIAQIDLSDPETNLQVQLALKLITSIRGG
ncbi:MAG: helix-turn-helix domain-containing protein [Peptococcaceae bacterium]|jgi:sugar diacid utilization regulator|nr:helix-turn-helix domain-containing protein [Peptococcaceae bacterium]